jgi:hypothetical protein
MSNVALVSLKLAPDLYAILKALAASEDKSLSALVRETVVVNYVTTVFLVGTGDGGSGRSVPSRAARRASLRRAAEYLC